MLHLVFIHGWGFDRHFWDKMAAQLSGDTHLPAPHHMHFIDFGFTGTPNHFDLAAFQSNLSRDDRLVIIGHSLGVVWALTQLQQVDNRRIDHIIAFNGFDGFTQYIPPIQIQKMQRNLTRNPLAQMRGFYQACGLDAADITPNTMAQIPFDTAQLAQGLGWLSTLKLDIGKDIDKGQAPKITAIASRDDQIFPASASQSCWGSADIPLIWVDHGGHALPLTRPDICAQYVIDAIMTPDITGQKHNIANNFAKKTQSYDKNADLQQKIAQNLAKKLPDLQISHNKAPRILEIGCGTGFLTKILLQQYPDAAIDVTDISPAMIDFCRNKCGQMGGNLRFFTLDGEYPDHPNLTDGAHNLSRDPTHAPSHNKPYDLIVSSMAVQWFDDPLAGLARLSRLGPVYYATLGGQSFPQWRDCLASLGLDAGLLTPPDWLGIMAQDIMQIHHDHAIDFLRSFKQTGAHTPRPGYIPITPKNLRAALNILDQKHGARTDWQIIYGRVV